MIRKYIIVLMVPMFMACSKTETKQEVAPQKDPNTVVLSQKQFDAAGIATSPVQKQKISNHIQANGIIDVPPQNLVVISPPMPGFVKSTSLKEGMKVKKGDLLAVLENMDFIQLQQDYLENKSKLQYLEEEFHRQEELAKENVNAVKTLQLSRSNYEATRSAVSALEAKLAMINITPQMLAKGEIRSQVNLYSPIDGFVSSVHITLGQFVNPVDPMFRIVNLDHVHVLLYVYEKDIPYLREHQQVRLRVAGEQQDRVASVYLIGKEITAERTIHVHCHLKEEALNLLQGMYVSATIDVQEKESDVVPGSAILTYLDKHIVFASTGKPREYKMVEVVPGETAADFVEVSFKDPVSGDIKIVTSGADQLLGVLKNSGDEE